MKSVLLSTRPKWCEKICHEIGTDKNGKPIYEKPIEVRKTKPSIPTPFKVFIYETYDKKYDGIGICWGKGKSFEHGCKKVIGEFICDKVYPIKYQGNRYSVADEEQSVTNEIARQSCLDYDDMVSYLGNKDGYGWHISQLKIYDKPKELREFYKPCPTKEKGDCLSCDCLADNDFGGICTNNLTRPPQSYMYVEEV